MVNGEEIIRNKAVCHLDAFMIYLHLNHRIVKTMVARIDKKNADNIFP